MTADERNKVNILIVDDDQQFQRYVCALLEELDFNPIAAKTGWEALEQCQLNPPHIIITDIFMPYLDGVKLIDLVKQSSTHIPIIAMTGGLTGSDTENHLQSAWLSLEH